MSPSLFQVLALSGLVLLVIITIAATFRGSIGHMGAVAWLLVWIAAGIAIAWPTLTARMARLLGIGRGTDLVLYCAVVVMLVGFLMVYARLRRLRRELTLLVRHLAIEEALGGPGTGRQDRPEGTGRETTDPTEH